MDSRLLTVTYASGCKNNETPAIKLQGKWLKNFGFKVGNRVVVEVEKGKLIIKDIDILENSKFEYEVMNRVRVRG